MSQEEKNIPVEETPLSREETREQERLAELLEEHGVRLKLRHTTILVFMLIPPLTGHLGVVC